MCVNGCLKAFSSLDVKFYNKLGNKKDGTVFGWGERYKVALGVAEALNYLHTASQPVIHRDVKSSNILLLDDFEPQVPFYLSYLILTDN